MKSLRAFETIQTILGTSNSVKENNSNSLRERTFQKSLFSNQTLDKIFLQFLLGKIEEQITSRGKVTLLPSVKQTFILEVL